MARMRYYGKEMTAKKLSELIPDWDTRLHLKLLWLIFRLTKAKENGIQWQRVFRWDTPSHWASTVRQTAIYSELLLLRASLQETDRLHVRKHTHTHTYIYAHWHVHRQTRSKCARAEMNTNTHNHSGIKVIESWQIGAAAESLTWGCWIDKPSIGTLLASSSF